MAIIDVDNIMYKPKADDAIAWKFPRDDVSKWTKLIVAESQEAIFLKDGKIVGEPLGPQQGGHVLSTKNIPWLRGIVAGAFGGQTRSPAQVWIVNKMEIMAIKWGTTAPLLVEKRRSNSDTPIGFHVISRGDWSMQIIESQEFLTKMVINKTLPEGYFGSKSVKDSFRGTIQQQLSRDLNILVNNENISATDFMDHIIDLGESIKRGISPEFQRNGIEIKNFNVERIDITDDDKVRLRKFEDYDLKATNEGYKMDQEIEIAKIKAANPNSGLVEALSGGFGLGVGIRAGGPLGQQIGSAMDTQSETINPTKSDTQNDSAEKLQQLEQALAAELITEEEFNEKKKQIESDTQNGPVAKLQQLKEMLAAELITEEEFNEKKKQILDSM